jgi:ribosomal protein S18 acetylase RimI-like enzyme
MMLRATLKQLLPPGVRWWLREAAEFVHNDVQGVVAEKRISVLSDRELAGPASSPEIIEVAADANAERYLSLLRRAEGTLGTRKARHYLRRGFRGFAALREGQVVGVVWSVRPAESKLGWVHEDLRWLRLRLADDEAYMFDMFIEPEHRGLAMCTALFRAGFRAMRARGVGNVKGYYVRDNKPALWMHRMAGYREVGRVHVRRILGFTWSYDYVPLAVAPAGEPRPAGSGAEAPARS